MDWSTTFKIFAEKTFKEKKFYWARNLFFTLFPLLFFFLYFVIIGNTDDKVNINNFEYANRDRILQEEDLIEKIPQALGNKIYFVPNNAYFSKFMEDFRYKNYILDERVIGFPSEDYAWSSIGDLGTHSFMIIFDANETSVNKRFSYKIRTKSNDFHTDQQYSKDLYGTYHKSMNEYIETGFLGLKMALDAMFIEQSVNEASKYHLEYERMPRPSTKPKQSNIGDVGLYMIIFSVLISISLIFTRLVDEKACGFREQLKNASRFSFLNNAALFLVNVLQMLGLFLLCLAVTYFKGVWFSVNAFYGVLLIFFYVISIISFTFLVSSLFEQITFSTVGAVFWYFVPFFCYHLATPQWKTILIIFPVNAFYQGFQIFHDYTNSGHYYCHSNFFQISHPNDGVFAMSTCIFWLIVSTGISIFLYFYISNVWPGKYGIRQSPLFCFNKSYYVPNQIDAKSEIETLDFDSNGFENFQHLNQHAVARIRNLTKVYGNNTVVKNLSMDIYKNQITILLGHNGAGKTTTMCIMTGLIPTTSGSIYVDNTDNVQFYRSKIGYCPQHNISLPYMTCREHLEFFGQLRGLQLCDAEIEAKDILSKVNLQSKADQVAKKLSGGMLRKLCLANAIIGNTKLLILDEPSSGLDPESRRDIWNILLKLKKNHTILVTTHFMEEADVLGDKVAIMENGELISYGTSMFLKSYYGSGYTLKMLKSNDTNFDEKSVHNTIKRHIPSADQKSSVKQLYCMTLPYKDKHKYGEMLRELEMNQKLFGIESISITNTTMEEVFLNSAAAGVVATETDEVDAGRYSEIDLSDDGKTINRERIYLRQFFAKFYKKFIYWQRNIKFFSAMVLIPIMMTWLCFWLSNYLADRTHMELELNAQKIENPKILVNFKGYNIDSQRFKEILGTISKEENFEFEVLSDDANFENEFNEIANNSLLTYYDNILGGIELEASTKSIRAKIFYSQNLIHSIGILTNIVDNAMIKFFKGDSYEIEVVNFPLNRQDDNINYIQNLYTEFVPIGLMLYMIMFLPFTFKEKASGFKNLQNIPGSIYWSATYLSDIAVHFVVVLVIMLLTILGRDGLAFTFEELGYIGSFFFVYGLTNLIIVYITSQFFSSLSGSIMFLNYLQILSLFGVILMSSTKDSMKDFGVLITFFHILPDFSLKHSLKVIHQYHKFVANHMKVGNDRESVAFQNSYEEYREVFEIQQFFLGNFIVLLISCAFLFIFVENQRFMEQFECLCSRIHSYFVFQKPQFATQESIEMDLRSIEVEREKKFVDEILCQDKIDSEAMIVGNLEKVYDKGFKAVQGISFSVKKSECFGLLGMNGAGKTSTFEMMTLNRTKTNGKVFINGVNPDDDPFLYRHQFGYCPQQDALCEYMTSREMLKYMLMINGNMDDIDRKVESWLMKINIEKYRDRNISTYSGGTKRKLNAAMAMICDPFIIFLDEPTTGVDPKSRRYVWSCIKNLQQQKKTIVLTSHSMDECEMLCNRLGIMKNGELKCIGYIQKLKETYGKGFSLMIKVKPKLVRDNPMQTSRTEVDSIDSTIGQTETITDIKLQISRLFTCELRDEHDGVLQYFIQTKNVSWSNVFKDLLKFSKDHETSIDNFSIQETTLEDIFQQFRNDQT